LKVERFGDATAPNARLGFGEAADLWLAGPVLDLRPATQAGQSRRPDSNRGSLHYEARASPGRRGLGLIGARDAQKPGVKVTQRGVPLRACGAQGLDPLLGVAATARAAARLPFRDRYARRRRTA
jgi:hypothetical protein